jgi:hypothetical protein
MPAKSLSIGIPLALRWRNLARRDRHAVNPEWIRTWLSWPGEITRYRGGLIEAIHCDQVRLPTRGPVRNLKRTLINSQYPLKLLAHN